MNEKRKITLTINNRLAESHTVVLFGLSKLNSWFKAPVDGISVSCQDQPYLELLKTLLHRKYLSRGLMYRCHVSRRQFANVFKICCENEHDDFSVLTPSYSYGHQNVDPKLEVYVPEFSLTIDYSTWVEILVSAGETVDLVFYIDEELPSSPTSSQINSMILNF